MLLVLLTRVSKRGTTIKQRDFDSEVIIGFILNLSYQQILQLLEVIKVLRYTLRHCHKQFVE